jgi:3-oxoacyl-[acyl-carrier protein] reductase
MHIRFDERVIVVTGASGGIGAALARAFGAAGGHVAVHYRTQRAAAEAVAADIHAAGGQAVTIQADFSDAAATAAFGAAVEARFGRVDVLVNNAGDMFERRLIADTPDDHYTRIMDANVASLFRLCRWAIPLMQAQGRGNIVNMSSISARRGGGGGSVLYGASKAAVSAFTRGLALELAPHHIRVNAVAPGLILTPLHDKYTPPARLQAGIAQIPLGRAGTPADCVGAVLFLASDALSAYITGQVIEVNGGLLMP